MSSDDRGVKNVTNQTDGHGVSRSRMDAEDDEGGADVAFNCFAIGGWRRRSQ